MDENMQNTLKINDKQTAELFCKYLRNESSDLHEILCGGQSLSHIKSGESSYDRSRQVRIGWIRQVKSEFFGAQNFFFS